MRHNLFIAMIGGLTGLLFAGIVAVLASEPLSAWLWVYLMAVCFVASATAALVSRRLRVTPSPPAPGFASPFKESTAYQTLFESANDAIFLMHGNRFVDCNYRTLQIFRCRREEIIGHTPIELSPEYQPDGRLSEGKARSWIDKAYGGEPCIFEWRHKRPDGSLFDVQVSLNRVDVENESFLQAIVRDVTDQKLTENALLESERRYRRITEAITDYIYTVYIGNGEALKTVHYPGCNRVTGYSPEEFDANPALYREMIAAEDIERVDAHIASLMEDLEFRPIEHRIIHKDGSLRWVRNTPIPSFDSGGNLVAYDGIVKDITEENATEQALRDSEAKFRELTHLLPEGVYECDIYGRFTFANEMALRYFGYEDTGIPSGFSITDVLVPEDHERARAKMRRVLAGERLGASEYTGIRKGGSRFPITIHSSAVYRDRKPVGMRGIVIDNTERKRREDELARTEKLESLGILAGGIAHDFNNILTGILGNVSLARMEIPKSTEPYARLSDAEKAAIRAKDLTQQLLAFAKGGEPIKQTASLAEIVRDCVAFSLSGSNVTYEVLAADDLLPVEVDTGQISQVVQNLVINADHAMPDGGRIVIRMNNYQVADDSHLPLAAGRYVCMTVNDTGGGIAPDILPKIFDPYFTTKQHGSGLGLASTFSVIKRHEGHIAVESEPGKGTCFTLYLPASLRPAADSGSRDSEPVKDQGRILVMDDELFIRELLRKSLGKFGYEVDCVADGGEAVETFSRAHRTDLAYDLVILDLTVPGGKGGREAIVEMRKIAPDIPAIVSSGYSKDPLGDLCETGLFNAFIPKPFKADDMVCQVQDVLRKARGRTPTTS